MRLGGSVTGRANHGTDRMKLHIPGLAATAALALAASAATMPAVAQGKPPAQITLTNMRSAPVTSFEIATGGEQPRLVGKLARPLAPGKSTTIKLNKPSGCTYFLLAKFGDDVESEGDAMDLCKDRLIRLTD